MRKLTLALLGASTAIALCAGAAQANPTNVIFDPYIGQNPGSQSYSHMRDSGNWLPDASNGGVSGDPFNSGNITVGWSGTDVILRINSSMPLAGVNYDPNGQNLKFAFADLFFDVNDSDGVKSGNTTDWDFGLDINNGYGADGYGQNIDGNSNIVPISTALVAGTKGKLVAAPTFSIANSAEALGFQQTKICADPCPDTPNGRDPEVEVIDGNQIGEFGIQDLGDGEGSTTHLYQIVLAGVNTDGSWDTFRLFWGTGWCANDTVEGTVTIPVPAALPIFAAAMAGFGFAGWRRRKTAA